MEMALYHDVHGYYADPARRAVGREGDFYTSVAVGDTFGMLLSHRIRRIRRDAFGSRADFVIVEQGAHDGQLARDILAGIDRDAADWAADAVYRIVEPRGGIRKSLEERFADESRVEIVASLEEARAPAGLFLCNELLDAFPVRRLEWSGGGWRELGVTAKREDGGIRFSWKLLPETEGEVELPPELDGRSEFPEGYRTEYAPGLRGWMSEAARLFDRGLWWIVDYGLESGDYYDVGRTDGTLRCYRGHRAHNDPFSAPGETDLTAHVNFTHLRQWAEEAGLVAHPLTDQHHFLVEAARPWLLRVESEGRGGEAETAKRLRQFQTLTHPALMGRQFRVAEFAK